MQTKRVVITGIGIVSSIGSNKLEVLESLRTGRSGITFSEDMASQGFRSCVEGRPLLDPYTMIDRKASRFMSMGSAWNYIAMKDAIADAGLMSEYYFHNPRVGIIMGSGGPSTSEIVRAADMTRNTGGTKKIGPYSVPKTMSSTASATLAIKQAFGIQGANYSVTAACSTSALNIRSACMEIQMGHQDVVLAGGSEELDWTLSNAFDAMGAMSSKYNDTPTKASRAYDKNRDGFVIAAGAGVLVLEEYEKAIKRGAPIYAEVGYGHTSDGEDMVAPSGEGAVRCMKMALEGVPGWDGRVDYINTHATSTLVGDVKELMAIKEVIDLSASQTKISGTKCLAGHSLGATSVHEAIYTLLMMQHGFVSANANVENLDPKILAHQDLVDALVLGASIEKEINLAISNSFGFGGTNATLVFRKV